MKRKTRMPNLCCLLFLGLLMACEGPAALFKSQYAHQRYEQQLRNAGLEKSALYLQWLGVATQSLTDAQSISIPYQERAFFAADRPQATAFVFDAQKGERLEVLLEVQASDSVQLFVDLFERQTDASKDPKHLVSADTSAFNLSYEIQDNGSYLLRVQPELLVTVSYHLQITAEPSLASPVAVSAKSNIGSFFGDGRDGGRKHEGVDIFAQRLTPVVAAADGMVSRVGTNNLGGNVVWLRPKGKSLHLYYAHLDTQLVAAGKQVKAGDTLGLMGNTGNARTTPPHLHFGIYTNSGAIDPLPFLRPEKSNAPKIIASNTLIGDTLRVQSAKNSFTSSGQRSLALNRYMPVYVEAATQRNYRVLLPDGRKGLIPENQLLGISKPLRSIKLKNESTVYDKPDSSAAQLGQLAAGVDVKILADYGGFYLVEGLKRGWVKY